MEAEAASFRALVPYSRELIFEDHLKLFWRYIREACALRGREVEWPPEMGSEDALSVLPWSCNLASRLLTVIFGTRSAISH